MKKRKLDELVDLEGADDATLKRLQSVHDQLVEAGPPPDLPPALAEAPTAGGRVAPLRSRRRRLLAGLAFAAAIAAACFGGGFLLGHSTGSGSKTVRVVAMEGERNSLASLKIGQVDMNGNWPMELTVAGLPHLHDGAYYVLMLEENGKPRFPCGSFRVSGHTTTVHFSVPYEITKSSRWVVTSMRPGVHFPGHVVMTTE